MEVQLSDDQEFFGDTTRKFLAEQSPVAVVRELADDEDGFDPDFWRRGAELGWTSLLVEESHGGGSISGEGVVDLTVVADAFGRHVAPGPLLPANVVASAVSRSGSQAQRDGHLGPILSGELIGAWCGSDLALGRSALTAVSAGADHVISGTATPVEAGAQADLLLLSASTEAGPTQFLVPAGTAGLEVEPLSSVDVVRRFARLHFNDVRVPADAVVGDVGGAAGDVERQLQLALVMQSSEMVGAAEKTFDFTVEWAFDRYSFGRPLASYQELKHRFADMKTWLEASHALAAALAREVQVDAAGAAETASVTKAYIGEYLAELMQDCVQMHGGIGLTADHDLHLYLRRVACGRATYGLPGEHRQRIAAIVAA